MDTLCIEWWGGTNKPPSGDGYGYLHRDGRKIRAHRMVWEECFGPIPPGLYVLHHCDNRTCVNPEHLYVGTHADNMRDMVERGRGRSARGADTHCSHGHEFTPENTGHQVDPRNGRTQRVCRKCAVRRTQEYQARKRASA
jgi:hypothetical protein